MREFFHNLFDTDGFPPRWNCGSGWTGELGWLHILSDVAIFGAYAAIPIALVFFIRRRKDVPLLPIFWLFAVFILACGLGHLVDASIFWKPWYRFLGVLKFFTAVVSWITVFALIKALPVASGLPGLAKVNQRLEVEMLERKASEDRLLTSLKEVQDLRAALDEHALVAITNPKGRITFVNDQFCAVSKYSREELLGQDHRIINSGQHSHEFMRELWTTIRSGKVWKGEIKNRAKDGSHYWVDTTIVPFLDLDGKPVQYVAIRNEITERKVAQLKVERMSERLGLATQGSGVGIWDWDINNNLLLWDENMCRLYGLESKGLWDAFNAWRKGVHPDDFPAANKELEMALGGEKPFDTTFRVVWPDGSIHHIRAHGIIQRDAEGKSLRMTGTNWDITDHRVAEEKLAASLHEKEVLLKEIHHRVKNNMQVISSLLNLQSEQITDEHALAAFRESQFRVKSMALLHEKLYQSENLARINFGEYLESLLDYLFTSFGSKADHIEHKVEVDNVWLSLDTAIPCGLIVNELASNALKYAFAGRAEGAVRLTMGLGGDGLCHLRFRDNGVGLPHDLDWRKTNSLGLQLVKMLTRQLRGTIEYHNGVGAEFHIAFQERKLRNPVEV